MKSSSNRQLNRNRMKTLPWPLWVATALSLVVTLGACVEMTNKGKSGFRKNYGYLSPNEQVTTDFESYKVNPEYRYYFSGPDQSPNAVIGIHKDIELVSKFWKPQSVSADRLRNWIWWMNYNYSQTYNWKPRGYKIMDPEGNPAGVWYSACDYTVIKRAANGGLAIYTPISGPCFPPDVSGGDGRQSSITDDAYFIPKNSRASADLIFNGG